MDTHTPTSRSNFWRDMKPGDHACHVYKNDDSLLDTLCGYVGGGLWTGEGAVVIATDAHVDRLEEMLRQTGLDLAHFRAADAYIPLSAEASLGRFMEGDMPDGDRFETFVASVLQRARRGGRPVRAFGEMVAVLWSRGQSAATVRLETLWNETLRREKIRLLCGYPKEGFERGPAASIRLIDAAHTVTARC